MRSILRPLGLIVGATFATTAHADTFWDVSAEDGAELIEALKPGDVLVRMCPGCGGEAQVVELRSLRLAPGDYSDGHQLVMRWRGVAAGPVGRTIAVPPLSCMDRPSVCLQGQETDCAGPVAHLDVPYTFVLREDAWVWVGSLAELQAPGPRWSTPLPATDAQLQTIPSCRRLRPGPARDHGGTAWGQGPHSRPPRPKSPR